MKSDGHRVGTYANRYTVLFLALWELHDEFRSSSLLGIVQRAKTAHDFNRVLCWDLAIYSRHYCTVRDTH